MTITKDGKTYVYDGIAESGGARLRFRQEDGTETLEIHIRDLMNDESFQPVQQEDQGRAADALCLLKQTQALYESNVQKMVFQHPDKEADGFDALWGIFWKACGRELAEKRERYESSFLKEMRRAVKVGDGMTIHYFSDVDPVTIIRRTAKTLTVQEDLAERDPSFKPEWVPGGFSAICTNQDEQKWNISRNPDGRIMKLFWSEKYGVWRAGGDGSITASLGRNKFYDYNF